MPIQVQFTAMKLFVILVFFGSLCQAHSWVERLMKISTNGTLIGAPGYIRGAVSRLSPDFSDHAMMNLLPPEDGRCIARTRDSDMICKGTQAVGNYSSDYPRLRASPGDFIALQFQENGHVTLPWNSPQKANAGKVFIYGTPSSIDGETLHSIHKAWNEEGTGGNQRGKLLAVWPFDDGRCYQINDGPISVSRRQTYRKEAIGPQYEDLWCQADIRLPVDIHDQYTLYWVWDWPSMPSQQYPSGQTEIYTSCMDILLDDRVQDEDMDYGEGQDLNFAAVEDQVTSPALQDVSSTLA